MRVHECVERHSSRTGVYAVARRDSWATEMTLRQVQRLSVEVVATLVVLGALNAIVAREALAHGLAPFLLSVITGVVFMASLYLVSQIDQGVVKREQKSSNQVDIPVSIREAPARHLPVPDLVTRVQDEYGIASVGEKLGIHLVVDTFAQLVSGDLYRDPLRVDQALVVLRTDGYAREFDSNVVTALERVLLEDGFY